MGGDFDESYFWIDKIKSNCYVKYNDVSAAINSRKLIHGKKWPSSNPKTLRVFYSSETDLEEAKKGKNVTANVIREKNRSASRSPRRFGGMRSEKDFERDSTRKPSERQHISREKERSTSEESEEEPAGPGSMLDDLFKKTKAQPSLYWLPLTDEEIAERDRAREERKK